MNRTSGDALRLLDPSRGVTAGLTLPKPAPRPLRVSDFGAGQFFRYKGNLWAVVQPAAYLMTLVRQLSEAGLYVNKGTDLLNKNTEVELYSI
jgi:hypothetical protein